MEGGTTFRWVSMQKFRSVWYQVEKDLELREGIQNSGRQKQKCNLDPSAVFTCVDTYLSAGLSQSARVVKEAQDGTDQSQRSKIFLDQSESSIQPM